MTTIAGVDGCPSGWLCIFQEMPARSLTSKVFPTIADLFAFAPQLQALAIDIPIGLTESGPRACDLGARGLLGGGRASSVFPAPIRPALQASSYPEACEASFRAQGKKLSKQSWAIYPKIREVDQLLLDRADLRERVYEIHPEVTFAEWNGGAILEPKRSGSGFLPRHELVTRHFGADAFKAVRALHSRSRVADDDILDAYAALWTAERIVAGTARTLPPEPALDSIGLPMRMMV
jgi:predicted RNase H-like nuclease